MPPRHLPATRSWASPPRTPPPSLRTRRARTSSCWGGGDTLGTDRPASVGLTVSTRRGGQRSPDQTRSRGASGHRPQAEPRAGTGRQLRPVPWPRTQLRGRPRAPCAVRYGDRHQPSTAAADLKLLFTSPGSLARPKTLLPKCTPPPRPSCPPPRRLNPCGFQRKLNPYVSGSFTLNSSKCNFATSS